MIKMVRKTLVSALILLPLAAMATPITVYYEAEITQVSDQPSLDLFAPLGIATGETITGSFTYDSTNTNTADSVSNVDSWSFDSITGETAVGPITLQPSEISAAHFPSVYDQWELLATTNAFAETIASSTGDPLEGRLQFITRGGFGFSELELGLGTGRPVVGPPLNAQYTGSISYADFFFQGSQIFGRANFTASLSLNAPIRSTVPAPATIVLLGLGLAGLGWKRRKC